jgi:hypothetical protein
VQSDFLNLALVWGPSCPSAAGQKFSEGTCLPGALARFELHCPHRITGFSIYFVWFFLFCFSLSFFVFVLFAY